ncbi:MAG TPA: hypothetical protein VEZ71_29390, partial [Archangium sp.]|nr:hypothetical protein [Archangium sp.]
ALLKLLLADIVASTATSECGTDSLCILGNDVDSGLWPLSVGASHIDHSHSSRQDDPSYFSYRNRSPHWLGRRGVRHDVTGNVVLDKRTSDVV